MVRHPSSGPRALSWMVAAKASPPDADISSTRTISGLVYARMFPFESVAGSRSMVTSSSGLGLVRPRMARNADEADVGRAGAEDARIERIGGRPSLAQNEAGWQGRCKYRRLCAETAHRSVGQLAILQTLQHLHIFRHFIRNRWSVGMP